MHKFFFCKFNVFLSTTVHHSKKISEKKLKMQTLLLQQCSIKQGRNFFNTCNVKLSLRIICVSVLRPAELNQTWQILHHLNPTKSLPKTFCNQNVLCFVFPQNSLQCAKFDSCCNVILKLADDYAQENPPTKIQCLTFLSFFVFFSCHT